MNYSFISYIIKHRLLVQINFDICHLSWKLKKKINARKKRKKNSFKQFIFVFLHKNKS